MCTGANANRQQAFAYSQMVAGITSYTASAASLARAPVSRVVQPLGPINQVVALASKVGLVDARASVSHCKVSAAQAMPAISISAVVSRCLPLPSCLRATTDGGQLRRADVHQSNAATAIQLPKGSSALAGLILDIVAQPSLASQGVKATATATISAPYLAAQYTAVEPAADNALAAPVPAPVTNMAKSGTVLLQVHGRWYNI